MGLSRAARLALALGPVGSAENRTQPARTEARAAGQPTGRTRGGVNMLDRVLEPEVMDSAAEARDYDAMDHSSVNRLFVSDFLAEWNGRNPILDVGAGTAQIPIELCRQAPAAQVVAIDLAEQMLAVGRDNVRRAGLESRLRLERQDAKRMTYAAGSFAAI